MAEVEVSGWSELPFCLLEVIFDGLVSSRDYIRFGSVCSSWRRVFLDNIECHQTRQLPFLMIPLFHVDAVGSSNGYCNVLEKEEEEDDDDDEEKEAKEEEEEDDDDDYDDDDDEEEPTKKEENEKEKILNKGKICRYKRCLYSITDQMVYNFSVPVPYNVYCFGSSHGWLTTVVMDDDSYPIRLFNPFLPINNNEIKLTSLHTMPLGEGLKLHHYAYANKFVVSSDLTAAATGTTAGDHYQVMAIDDRGLAVWKPGEETWTPVETHVKCLFYDCIHYKGRFHAVNWNGEVVVMLDNNNPKVVLLAPPPPDTIQYASRKYIVEVSGELFQVQRDLDDTDIKNIFTRAFYIYKLLDYDKAELGEDKERKQTWREVDTLDGYTFFIGHSTSMSVQASEFPGCKPNCIYFTDDYIDSFIYRNSKPKDIGVYDVVNDSFDFNFHGRGRFQWPNPIWIEPTICKGS